MEKHKLSHYIFTIIYQIVKNLLLSFIFILIAITGYLVNSIAKSPYDLIFGVPLIFIGVGLLLNSLYSILLSIFSPAFNKGVCVICS
ncbi:MAG: hypothetical protein Q7T59_02120 [Candidatus Woesebacteria bacterium]|nr:hypothetical protein [Candidatus Woesebacteria bacterium]